MIFDVRKDTHITGNKGNISGISWELLLHQLLSTKRPKYLFDSFAFKSQLEIQTTRISYQISYQILLLSNCRTKIFKNSFGYTTTDFWNKLPDSIRGQSSLALFRMTLYKHLVNRIKDIDIRMTRSKLRITNYNVLCLSKCIAKNLSNFC